MQDRVNVTRAELAHVASRIFALIMLTWAFAEITYFPQYIHSLLHYFNQPIETPSSGYWKRYYLLENASLLLRTASLLLAVLIFWRGGPSVTKLFLPDDPTVEERVEEN